MMLTEEKERKK